MRTHYCGELRGEHVGQTVTLFGWVDRRRDHGGVIFIDLRDRSGIVQIVSDPERTSATYPQADALRNEYVVKIQGAVTQRPDASLNLKISTGEIEIYATTIEVLNTVRQPLPFQVSAADAESVREELRLKYRYLDLRRERMRQNLLLRHEVIKTVRRYLEDVQGFIEVETPCLNTLYPRRGTGLFSTEPREFRGMVCAAPVTSAL
jgi:aspartyl-tRNA synthetase